MVFTKLWWKAALIRAVRTIAQTAIATIGTTAVIEQVNWLTVLSASALAGILSLLTSIATGLPEVNAPTNDVRTIYLDEYGHEISEAEAEEMCSVKVRAYDDYYDDGSPKTKGGVTFPQNVDEPCEECDLTKYVEGGMNDD